MKKHIQEGRTFASLTAEYGISKVTVSNWVRWYREECLTNEEEMSKLELMEEVRRLRQQACVYQENISIF